MKIFIWEYAYGNSLVVVYAESLEQAFDVIANNDRGYGWLADKIGKPMRIVDCDKNKEPFSVCLSDE
jgi:hypothetical protein